MSDTVYQQFDKSVEGYANRPFLHLVSDTAERYGVKPGSITYGEADQEIKRLAAAYSALGIEQNQRVAIGLDNRPECFYHWLLTERITLWFSVLWLPGMWRLVKGP